MEIKCQIPKCDYGLRAKLKVNLANELVFGDSKGWCNQRRTQYRISQNACTRNKIFIKKEMEKMRSFEFHRSGKNGTYLVTIVIHPDGRITISINDPNGQKIPPVGGSDEETYNALTLTMGVNVIELIADTLINEHESQNPLNSNK